ncbi:MAG: carbohydrate kinase family protein [Actinomycetales bacterium]
MSESTQQPEAPGSAHVAVIGETVLDYVPRPDGTVAERVGGSPANVARGLSLLGQHVTLLTSLGGDDVGAVLQAGLEADGVELGSRIQPDTRSATARATLDADGRATYELDIPWDPEPFTVAEDVVWLHTGSLALVLEPGRGRVLDTLRAASARPELRISVDLNLRDPLPWDVETTRARIDELAVLADVVKASDDDLALLYPDLPDEAVAGRWLGQGRTELVVVTRGSRGSFALARQGSVTAPAPTVQVVDTVGAGDTFMAALIDGLLTQRPPLGAAEPLPAVLSRAGVAAALCCEREGAAPPTRRELDLALAGTDGPRTGTH